ncbi:MAG: hypothetical protein HY321_23085 [Armatimonadetes bacterium]|nr:hypothetical protein [Armatimonadota bacterium]
MDLADWQRNGWLLSRKPTVKAIADLLNMADTYLADCALVGLSAESRLSIAYTAALSAASAALAAAGYRVDYEAHHYRLIQSLEVTIGASAEVIRQFGAFRKKRNVAGYERAGEVSEGEAEEMVRLAQHLRREAERWIRAGHPGLLPP